MYQEQYNIKSNKITIKQKQGSLDVTNNNYCDIMRKFIKKNLYKNKSLMTSAWKIP